ncbi:MAG: hypothetical protein WC943_04415 [Elusimicrobiota bacterium]|jgi:hypothetical protein
MKEVVFQVRFGKKQFIGILAGLVLVVGATDLVTETLTMTAYYPAPAGIYQRLTTTGNTILARDDGKVGIGMTQPAADLDVVGETRLDGSLQVTGDAALGANLRVAGNAVVGGDTRTERFFLKGVEFPPPPVGTTLMWKKMTFLADENDDSYGAWSAGYPGAAHSDTCDGGTEAEYTCPASINKACTDVRVSGTATQSGTYSSWGWTGFFIRNDTCDGNRNAAYTCPNGTNKTCQDILWNRVRTATCISIPGHMDRSVGCTSSDPIEAWVPVAQ